MWDKNPLPMNVVQVNFKLLYLVTRGELSTKEICSIVPVRHQDNRWP